MALQLKTVLESGIEVKDAYARISTLTGTKNNLTIGVEYYISREAIAEGKVPFMAEYFDFVPSTEDQSFNFIKQGYEYLKTLPKFESAIDVLE